MTQPIRFYIVELYPDMHKDKQSHDERENESSDFLDYDTAKGDEKNDNEKCNDALVQRDVSIRKGKEIDSQVHIFNERNTSSNNLS